jgi:hypothetical protein
MVLLRCVACLRCAIWLVCEGEPGAQSRSQFLHPPLLPALRSKGSMAGGGTDPLSIHPLQALKALGVRRGFQVWPHLLSSSKIRRSSLFLA